MAHAKLELALVVVRIGPATEADAEGIEGDAKKWQDVYEKKWEPVEDKIAHRHINIIADDGARRDLIGGTEELQKPQEVFLFVPANFGNLSSFWQGRDVKIGSG